MIREDLILANYKQIFEVIMKANFSDYINTNFFSQ